ncbi:MAG: hypothetical protein K8R46_13420 [Pirellulales bacterium]|nr:hypothetical protein [Pirellulales bacterium]
MTKKDQNETVHTFEYDLLGRQTSDKITAVDGSIFQGVLRVEHDYEVRGMVEQVTSYDAATGGSAVNDVKLAYDDFGLLETDQQEHLGAIGAGSLSVQYARANGADNHTRLNTVTYPNGRVLHHEYSSGNDSDLSRVSYLSETNSGGTQYAAYTYLGAGQIVKVDYPQPDLRYNLAHGSGSDPYDGMDQFGRVVDLLWRDYGSSSDAVRIKHGYDAASNRLWREDPVAKAQTEPKYFDERYVYDGMYQLVALRRGQLTAAEDALVAGSEEFAEQWTLDQLGNWSNVKSDGDGDGDWELDQNRAHNKANEIVTIAGDSDEIAHDAAGNMIRAPKPDNWNDHYHFIYDAWNRLVEAQTSDEQYPLAIFEYDGLNRRIVKWTYDESHYMTDCRHYYYSDKWQVLEERVDQYTGEGPYSGSGIPSYIGYSGSAYYSGSGISGSGVPQYFRVDRQFVWGLRYVDDLILRDRDADNNTGTGNYGKTASGLEERLYALQDPNWNVVAIANTSGVTQERYCYTAYGKPSFLTSAFAVRNPNVSSYSWDTLYTGRQHDPETGFYHSRMRPLGASLGRFLGRDPIRDDDNPYRYVRNNPAIYTDPTGLDRWLGVGPPGHMWIIVERCENGKVVGYERLDYDCFGFSVRPHPDKIIGGANAKPGTLAGESIVDHVKSSCAQDEELLKMWVQKTINSADCPLGWQPGFLIGYWVGINCWTVSMWYLTYGGKAGDIDRPMPGPNPKEPPPKRKLCPDPNDGRCPPGLCFLPGTLVDTEEGLLAIEQIKPGTSVWSFNHDRKEWELNCVIHVHEHKHSGSVIEVVANEFNVKVTEQHSFWVAKGNSLEDRAQHSALFARDYLENCEGRWVTAGRLMKGDVLISRSGRKVVIEKISRIPADSMVYNLAVANVMNYTVQEDGILVHNVKRMN